LPDLSLDVHVHPTSAIHVHRIASHHAAHLCTRFPLSEEIAAVDPTDVNRTANDWDTVAAEVLSYTSMGTSEMTISAMTTLIVAAFDESWVTLYETDLMNPWQNAPPVASLLSVLCEEKMHLLDRCSRPRYPLVEQPFEVHLAVTSVT